MTHPKEKIAPYLALAMISVFTSAPVFAASDGTTGVADNQDQAQVVRVSEPADRPSDSELTRRIHRSIESDPSFSLLAHKIRIVAANGKVTLHGEVANQEERLAVGVRARRIAGPANVNNQLQIASTR
jgi:hypothetical protein